jgi:hypothetical protein
MSSLIDLEALSGLFEREVSSIHRNLLTVEQVNSAIVDGGEDGLALDLTGITTLLDGTEIDPTKIYGSVYTGVFPFESEETEWNYKRFRREGEVEAGEGLINTTYLVDGDRANSEGWDNEGTIAVRVTLYLEQDGPDLSIGTYDTYSAFRWEGDETIKLASFTEPPSVNLITSDDPSTMVIAFNTAEAEVATVEIAGVGTFSSDVPTTQHEIVVTGLQPDTDYTYTVTIGQGELASTLPSSTFTSAPLAGELPSDGDIITLIMSDSREGEPAEGMQAFMGVNAETLGQALSQGFQRGGDLLVFAGDLMNGYTSSPDDYRTQFNAFEQVVNPFHSAHPVYAAMGNHEALVRQYSEDPEDTTSFGVNLDRWDENGSYDTESSEAIFAEQLIHPNNSPDPSNPDRPSYDENVYSFQYGPIKHIVFNNNYWVSYSASEHGGSPEAYIFQDQIEWIRDELAAADADPTVEYIFLYAQEPVFPNGGHLEDTMWYDGDNNTRAYTYNGEELVPENRGILEVRDQFVRLVASYDKVAAVFSGDEHSYHRVLIDDEVPIGDVATDDLNGDNVIDWSGDEPASALSDLRYGVHYISLGGAGAPYFSEEPTPWNQYWNGVQEAAGLDNEFFIYSSQEDVGLLKLTETGLSLEVYSIHGELIDQVDDLMVDKNRTNGDAIVGTDGNDILITDAEDNKIFAFAGDDVVNGLGGNDVIYGDEGNDFLVGDDDGLSTLNNDDIIYGGADNDVISGKVGNDTLWGDDGNDQIVGDEGNDYLRGGNGNDVLIGDNFSSVGGVDTFVLAAGEGTDTIVDFEIGTDVVELAGGLTPEILTIEQVGADTAVSVNGEVLGIFSGINAGTLTAANPFVVA